MPFPQDQEYDQDQEQERKRRRRSLKRRVESDPRVGRAAILVVANLGAVEIEIPERNVSALERELGCGGQLPFQASTEPRFFVTNRGVIERRVAAEGPEVFFPPVAGQAQIRAGEKEKVAVRLVFEARRRHDGVERPLRSEFPAHATPGENWSLAQRVDADAEHKLEIRAVNISAADKERHIEGVTAKIVEVGAVEAGLRFDPNEKGIGELGVEIDNQVGGMEMVGDGRVSAEAEGITFGLQTQAQNSDFRHRRQDEPNHPLRFMEIANDQVAVFATL